MVRRDVKGLNCNEIIRSSFRASSLNKALLRVIRDRVPKQTIVGNTIVHTGHQSLGFMTCVVWLTVQSREHIECGVVIRRRLSEKSIGRLVVMLSLSM